MQLQQAALPAHDTAAGRSVADTAATATQRVSVDLEFEVLVARETLELRQLQEVEANSALVSGLALPSPHHGLSKLWRCDVGVCDGDCVSLCV